MATCARCKKGLTDPISIKRGYGPVCWAKAQADKSKEEQIVYDGPSRLAKRTGGGVKHERV